MKKFEGGDAVGDLHERKGKRDRFFTYIKERFFAYRVADVGLYYLICDQLIRHVTKYIQEVSRQPWYRLRKIETFVVRLTVQCSRAEINVGR